MDRILVVDDESSMRLGLTEVLERAGFGSARKLAAHDAELNKAEGT